MLDEETLAQINGKYVCPRDAGPAWREAVEAGIDMTLVEHNLELTPEQRLAQHQCALDFALSLYGAGLKHDPE
jgi:hypothetical protein